MGGATGRAGSMGGAMGRAGSMGGAMGGTVGSSTGAAGGGGAMGGPQPESVHQKQIREWEAKVMAPMTSITSMHAPP